MTQTADTGKKVTEPEPEMVNLTIDDNEISVPKGTLVIRAAELIGVQIPRFCDHPLLDPVGACRQCLVEVEGQRKPMASCTNMVTRHGGTHPVHLRVRGQGAARRDGTPADQPSAGLPGLRQGRRVPTAEPGDVQRPRETRFEDVKRTFPKPINISSQVLLDRERCVLCARCTRFSDQIAGDPFIELLERGALQQVGISADEPFESYFSGNTVQICPVGALTGTAYRFRARPFDLVSSPSVCEHCASGCAQRTDHRRGKVLRRLAGDDPEVNEEWNCDKGRWAFTYATQGDRITTPLIRDDDGALRPRRGRKRSPWRSQGLSRRRAAPACWSAAGSPSRTPTPTPSSPESCWAPTTSTSAPARTPRGDRVPGRPVAGRPMTVTYADLETAPAVLLVGFEPEEESPIVYLRLRKAARKRGLPVHAVAPFATAA